MNCTANLLCWCNELVIPDNVKIIIEDKYDDCLCPECIEFLIKINSDPINKGKNPGFYDSRGRSTSDRGVNRLSG